MAASGWTFVCTVGSSSEPGKVHTIKQHTDGRFGCSCTAYKFSQKENKTCKHLLAHAGQSVQQKFYGGAPGGGKSQRRDTLMNAVVKVQPTAGGEAFTFTRGIVFGDVE